MSADTKGVALIGRILARLASSDASGATSLAQDLGAARATTFAVLRQLESAGFVERDATGRIAPGPASARLGFARFGLGHLAGAAEALLPVLRDDTNASVALMVEDGDQLCTLARAAGPMPPEPGGTEACQVLEEPVAAPGRAKAFLRLHLPARAKAAEREAARRCLRVVADALSRPAADPKAPSSR